MVGGEDEYDRVGGFRFCLDDSRRERDAWRRIALARFADDVFGRELGAERADLVHVSAVCDDEDTVVRNESVEPEDGLFEQRFAAEEIEKLFRFVFSASRPEALAASAGHDDAKYFLHLPVFLFFGWLVPGVPASPFFACLKQSFR